MIDKWERILASAPRRAKRRNTASARTLEARSLGHKVGRESGLGTGIVGDDEHGVLTEYVAEVRGQAARALEKLSAGIGGPVVLGPDDVDRERGLAGVAIDAASGLDGESREIRRGRRRSRVASLRRVEGAAHRRVRERLPLAKTDKDAKRTRGDRTAERHALSIAEEQARGKQWILPRFAAIVQVTAHRYRVTIDGLAPDEVPPGFRDTKVPGRWVRTCSLVELERVLRVVFEGGR